VTNPVGGNGRGGCFLSWQLCGSHGLSIGGRTVAVLRPGGRCIQEGYAEECTPKNENSQ
jgi:hypothetical protein